MSELQIWDNNQKLQTVKEMYARNLTTPEFQTFLEIGKRTQLNPFLREIWAVKYKGAAQIFIGRDGYRRLIGRNPNYEYHTTDAVYENDKFECDLANGVVKHVYNLKDRGKLIGAYSIVKMKSSKIPFYVFAELKEYNSNQSLWRDKPATMIKKVSESQAIRMAIPSELNGTYTPEEFGNVPNIEAKKLDSSEKEIKNNNAQNIDDLSDKVMQLVLDKNISQEIISKWLEKAGVQRLDDLTHAQLTAIKNMLENQ